MRPRQAAGAPPAGGRWPEPVERVGRRWVALIALATLVAVELMKGFFPKLLDGKETKVALLLPILFTVGAKAAGWFQATEWVDALMWAFSGGAVSGLAHDKVLDPLKGILSSFLPKKPPTQ